MTRTAAAAVLAASLLAAAPAAGQEAMSCLILPWETIELAAPTQGIVAEILTARGAAVAKGDLIIRLDDSVQRAYYETVEARAADHSQLEQARVRRDIAHASVERNRSLFEQKLIQGDAWDQIQGASALADIDVMAAENALHLAELEVARAAAALEQTRIFAPTDAMVLDVPVSVGEAAGTGPLANLAVVDPLRIELFVGVESYAAWQVGAKILVRGSQAPEQPLEATVVAVDSVADAGTGVLRVLLEVPNPDRAILAGQQCTLDAVSP